MSGLFAYAPDPDEPFPFQHAMRLPLGSEVGAHRQTLREQSIDVRVGVPEATQDDVGESMFTRQAGLVADGSKYVGIAGKWDEKGRDSVEPLLNALIQTPNWLYTKQKHRRFGDNLLVQELLDALR